MRQFVASYGFDSQTKNKKIKNKIDTYFTVCCLTYLKFGMHFVRQQALLMKYLRLSPVVAKVFLTINFSF